MAYFYDPNPLASEKAPEIVFNNAFPGQDINVERVISAPGHFGLYPLYERKNRLRVCFIVLRNCLCEVHKSSKDIAMCRPPKHLIDLRQVFNVCIIKETIEVKDTCLCVMTPSETYYLAPDKSKIELENFYEEFLERSRDARSTMLVRPVFKDEYFEASWDVVVCNKPKLRRNYAQDEEFVDLVEKHPEISGRRRLCVRNASLVFFKMEIRPSSDTDGPYSRDCFFDFPVNVISRYGKQERYFFLQIGRCAEYGPGELWVVCEDGTTAKYMHERVDEINQRESDRRKKEGIKLTFPGISQRVMKSRAHRERSHTQHEHELQARNEAYRQQLLQKKQDERIAEEKENEENGTNETTETEKEVKSEVVKPDDKKDTETKRDEKKKEKSKVGGLFGSKKSKDKEKDDKNSSPKRGLASLMSFRLPKSFSKNSNDKSTDSSADKKNKPTTPVSARSAVVDPPDYHPSGLYPQYSQQEDYMAYDHKVDSRKSSAIPAMRRQVSQPTPREQLSIVPMPLPKDYVHMETTPDKMSDTQTPSKTKNEYVFPLQEARSYIYDSNDSASSPLGHSLTQSTSSNYAPPFHKHKNPVDSVESSYAYFDPAKHKRQHSGEDQMRPSTSGLSAVSGGRTHSLGSRPMHRGVDLRMAASTSAAVASASGSLNTVGSIAEEEEDVQQAGTSKSEATKSQVVIKPKTDSPTAGRHSNRSTPEITVTRDEDVKKVEVVSKETKLKLESTRRGNEANRKESRDTDEREEDERDVPTDLIDIRGRTHSLGSRSWMKSAALRKLTSKKASSGQTAAVKPTVSSNNDSASSSQIKGSDQSIGEGRPRADSNGSNSSQSFISRRRNTNRSLTSSGQYEDDDLMEIDFEAKSKTDSPLNRSRNSSLGVQMPDTIRSALDRAVQKQNAIALNGEKVSGSIWTENGMTRSQLHSLVMSLSDSELATNEALGTIDSLYPKRKPKSARSSETQRSSVKSIKATDQSDGKIEGGSTAHRQRRHQEVKSNTVDDVSDYVEISQPPSTTSPRSAQRKSTRQSDPEGLRNAKKRADKSGERRRRSKRESTSPDVVTLTKKDSSDSLERFERGDGMVLVSDVPPLDSLMAQRLHRPTSKSIGSRPVRTHRNRAATGVTANEVEHLSISRLKHLGDQGAIRKRSAAARLERQQHKHSGTLSAHEEMVVVVRPAPSARANSPSSVSIYSARHLRSPSPQFGGNKPHPQSCCCSAAGRRPRQSFISPSESSTSINRRGGGSLAKTSVGGLSATSRKSSTASARVQAKRSAGLIGSSTSGNGQRKSSNLYSASTRTRLGSSAYSPTCRHTIAPDSLSAKSSSTSTAAASKAATYYATSQSAQNSPRIRTRLGHSPASTCSASPRQKPPEDYVPIENYSDATHPTSIIAAIAQSVSPSTSAASSPSIARRKVAAPMMEPPRFIEMESIATARKVSHRHNHQHTIGPSVHRKNSYSSRHVGLKKCNKVKYQRSKYQNQPIIAAGTSTVDYVEVQVMSKSQFTNSKLKHCQRQTTTDDEEAEFFDRSDFEYDDDE
ncbi:Insulin receptor substrate 1 [Aphelenchoides besseyi]|nr:Insulin receptor substrate 1 [Aphelenchoides besseyi]